MLLWVVTLGDTVTGRSDRCVAHVGDTSGRTGYSRAYHLVCAAAQHHDGAGLVKDPRRRDRTGGVRIALTSYVDLSTALPY